MSDIGREAVNVSERELARLAQLMNEKYRLALAGRTFSVEAWATEAALQVCVTLAHPSQQFVYPVEARTERPKPIDEHGVVLALVDFVDSYFNEYLIESDEDVYVPIDWADHQFGEMEVQIRGQIVNAALEAQADAILAGAAPYQ